MEIEQEIDSLILRIWNEVETAFEHYEPNIKYLKAKEWGVKYISDNVEVPTEISYTSN